MSVELVVIRMQGEDEGPPAPPAPPATIPAPESASLENRDCPPSPVPIGGDDANAQNPGPENPPPAQAPTDRETMECKLRTISGITAVSFNFQSGTFKVSKDAHSEWNDLKPLIIDQIMDHFSLGKSTPGSDKAGDPPYSEIAALEASDAGTQPINSKVVAMMEELVKMHRKALEEIISKGNISEGIIAEGSIPKGNISEGNTDTLEFELDPGFKLLHLVAMRGQYKLAEALESASNEASSDTSKDRFAHMAKYLVQVKKHPVFVQDKYGCTPLQLAAACGSYSMVEMLLESVPPEDKKRYLDHQDDQIRFSALHGAVSHNNYTVVVLLLKNGADPQLMDVTRKTAFQAAPSLHSLQELLQLVVGHADVVPRPVIVQLMAVALDGDLKPKHSRARQRWFLAITKIIKGRKPWQNLQAAVKAVAPVRAGDTRVGKIISEHFKEVHKRKSLELVRRFVRGLKPDSFSAQSQSSASTEILTASKNQVAMAGHVKLVFYQQLVKGLSKLSYGVVKTFFEDSHQLLLDDMARFPIFAEFVDLISEKQIANDGDKGQDASNRRKLLGDVLNVLCDSSRSQAPAAEGAQDQGRSSDTWRSYYQLQTLNVEPVLNAAVTAGRARNVHAAVEAITSWVRTNTLGHKVVFLSGVTTELMAQLAMSFPSSCALLLNVVNDDVLEALPPNATMPSSSKHTDYIVKCSNVGNDFLWREKEKDELLEIPGYTETVVDALVDFGVPFDCIYKAVREVGDENSPNQEVTALKRAEVLQHFASLILFGFSGSDLELLISNNIHLPDVIRYIEDSTKPYHPMGVNKEDDIAPMPELIRDMLKQKLSPRIVDIIINAGTMFETTKYNNFRPGRPLSQKYPRELYEPKYTYRFVQMLLDSWREGTRNACGDYQIPPWSKDFIDGIFEPNDPLCTLLKSEYDKKLTNTEVYIQDDKPAATRSSSKKEEHEKQQTEMRTRQQEQVKELKKERNETRKLLWIYIYNLSCIHRWLVFLAAHHILNVKVTLYELWGTLRLWWYTVLRTANDWLWLQLWLSYLSGRGDQWSWWDNLFLWKWWRTHICGLPTRKKSSIRSQNSEQADSQNRQQDTPIRIIDAVALSFPILNFARPKNDGDDILTALVFQNAPSSWFQYPIVRALYGLHWRSFGRMMILLDAGSHVLLTSIFMVFFLLVLHYRPDLPEKEVANAWFDHAPAAEVFLILAVIFSVSMLNERLAEVHLTLRRYSWVTVSLYMDIVCYLLVFAVAIIMWASVPSSYVLTWSGITMLLMVGRLTLFGLVTETLCTAVLALLEILRRSKWFFLLIAIVYSGFVLAIAGLRLHNDSSVYSSNLFGVLLGDFQSNELTDNTGTDEDQNTDTDTDKMGGIWRAARFSAFLRSFYGVIMLIVFMNLLIATMNDTYDMVKEFREVEVMRLRSHMMVFVKHRYPDCLASLEGEVLHLLLHFTEKNSGRWSSPSTANISEFNAWTGRLTYMRTSIAQAVGSKVRKETDCSVGQLTEKQRKETERNLKLQLDSIEQRLKQQLENLEKRLTKQQTDSTGQAQAVPAVSAPGSNQVAQESK